MTPGARRFLAAALVLLVAVWAAGLLVRGVAGTLDLSVVRDLAADRSDALVATADALSLLGSGYVIFPLALLAAVLGLRLDRLRDGLTIGLSTLGAVIIENIDKLLVARPRPPVHHLEHVTSFSFPSGHATQSTAFLAGLLIVVLRRRPPPPARVAAAAMAAALAAGIAFSRVLLGVHYPTDVATGVLLGATWALVVGRDQDRPLGATARR